jgi:hypothetical protein
MSRSGFEPSTSQERGYDVTDTRTRSNIFYLRCNSLKTMKYEGISSIIQPTESRTAKGMVL